MKKSIVLVAEDHALVRKMVCSLFQARGFEVWAAENGAEAVKKAQEVHPDLIVLDLAMPVMNGLEAARLLKGLLPQVPLMMFTNVVGPIMEQEARAAGISVTVSKSEPAERLIAHAKSLLN